MNVKYILPDNYWNKLNLALASNLVGRWESGIDLLIYCNCLQEREVIRLLFKNVTLRFLTQHFILVIQDVLQ